MNLVDIYFKDKDRVKEKYRSLILEYLEDIKKNRDLKVVAISVFNDKDKFINSIELVHVIDHEKGIYIPKRQDEVESLEAAQIIQKFIIANLNL